MLDKIGEIMAKAIEEIKSIEVNKFDTGNSADMWALLVVWIKLAEIQEIVWDKIKWGMSK